MLNTTSLTSEGLAPNQSASLNITYCDLRNFDKAFRIYHGYLSLLVCVFGSITNVLNICVLTTKQMRSPTNFILTGLAIADLLVMLEYIPFVFLFNENRSYAFHFTWNLAVFVVFHALFTQAFHFISCCLTVLLAVWRYVAIKFPQNQSQWFHNSKTKLTIFLTYLLCPFVCTPLYLSLKIEDKLVPVDRDGLLLPSEHKNNASYNATVYITNYKDHDVLKYVSFYVYGVVIKLVPCILLTVLSSLLIVELLGAKERRRNLMNSSSLSNGGRNQLEISTNGTNGVRRKSNANSKHLERERQADRTTRMLLAVLLLFLMVEFPQAIFGLLNHIIGAKFEKECYRPLGDLIDIFALTNSAINFVLYCTMSVKFRVVFKELFFPYIPCVRDTKEEWMSLQTSKSYV